MTNKEITIEEAIELLKDKRMEINYKVNGTTQFSEALNMAIKALEQQSKTGHWSRKTKVDAYDIAGVKTYGIKCQCDRCDFTTIVIEDFGYYKYCPNCGAKMEGEE